VLEHENFLGNFVTTGKEKRVFFGITEGFLGYTNQVGGY